MDLKQTKRLIALDYNRLICNRGGVKAKIKALFSDSFMITFWFRIGSWLLSKKNIMATLLLLPIKCLYKIIQHITGIQLPIGTDIQGGLRFHHYNCIIIAASSHIGQNVSIHHGVTIGRVFSGKKAGVPTIGNNVVIFAGAKIVGAVHVGNNVVIGTNAVVVNDVPDNSVVAGIPAKVISNNPYTCFDDYWRKEFAFNIDE